MRHHGAMELIVSTLFMVGVFIFILILERRHSRRTNAFFKRTEPQVDKLAETVTAKYRERYGKDPTTKITTIHDDPEKKT